MADNSVREQLEIELIAHAQPGRQWWVCAYAVRADGTPLSGGIPTSRILGQYESMAAAQAAHPTARLSYKTKRMLDDEQKN